MKKLTTSVLAVVLSSSFAVVSAQTVKDTANTTDIEGVVVTALGIKREKKSLGYASQEIKASALSDGTTNTGNIASQLSGKVAGLNVTTNTNFGGSANLVIRGIKGVGGGNPLIVIDGSPVNNSSTYGSSVNNPGVATDYGNALSDINQEDIESINVLKGAAASALYGERGLNGVIVIVTKNGKGKDDKSWGVTLSSTVQAGFIDKSTFPKYQTKYGAGYAPSFSASAVDGTPYANFEDDASWGPAFNPNLMVYQWDSFDPSSPNFGKATPWVAAKNGPIEFFNTPVTYTNTVTLEKGQKGKNILFTYDNMTADGLMPNSHIGKNTMSLKVNYDLTEKLHSSFYSTLTLQDTRGRNTTGYNDNLIGGFRQWWQTNVDVKDLQRAYQYGINNATSANNYGNVVWNRTSAANGEPKYWNNPYFQVYENYASDKRYRSFSYGQLVYDFNKNFSVTGKVSYDRSNLSIENRLAQGTLLQAFGASGNNVGSGYSRQDITQTETNYDAFLNYKFDVTDDINVSGIAGGNIRRNYYNSIYASTEGGLVVPGIYSISNSVLSPLAPKEDLQISQTNSLYATASVDFYKTFYLDGTFRRDQSSTLPASDNTYYYPSVTGSFIASELIKADWLSFWKLRANYAEVGGTAPIYSLINTYTAAGVFNNGESSVGLYNSVTTNNNQNLKPQRSKEFEVGTEVHFLKDRITLDLAYYKTKTIDQIIALPVSSATGYTTQYINAGQIDNKGYEVSLGLVPFKTPSFTWNMDINWSKNENKVVALSGDSQNYLLASFQGGVSMNARIGESWGTLIGSDYVYLNGEKVVNATTGRYLREDNKVIGNATPDWIGGVRNSFNYKGFSLSFLIDVRKGGDIFSLDQYYGLATGLYAGTENYRESGVVWEGVNPNGQTNTTVTANPSAFGSLDGYARMPAKRFVYDGSYVKLREASIGYSLPKSLLFGTFVNEAKVSIVGRNLWIIHKNLPGADPEAMVGGGIRSYGYSIGSLPTTRDIGVNVTLKF